MVTMEQGEVEEQDFQERLRISLERYEELEVKLDQLFEKLRMSRSDFSNYLSNPSNFSKTEWEIVQLHRDRLIGSIWRDIGQEKKKEIDADAIKKEGDKRARKTIGSRRKGWIQM